MFSKESSQESKTLQTDNLEEVLNLNNEQPYDFDNPAYQFIPKGVHAWRQEGCYVVCRSCDCSHAIFIGMDKIMTGIDEEGKPIFKSR